MIAQNGRLGGEIWTRMLGVRMILVFGGVRGSRRVQMKGERDRRRTCVEPALGIGEGRTR